MATIFRWSQQVEDLDEFQAPVSHLTAAAVCKRWRTIATETPSLWRQISATGARLEWTKLCLERSATCPLLVTLDWTHDAVEDDASTIQTSESLTNALDLLIPEASRWESFWLAVEEYILMYETLERFQKIQAPNLRHLRLSNHDEFDADERFEPESLNATFNIFSADGQYTPPPLQAVFLWGVHIEWSSNLLTQLTDLTLAYHCHDVRPPLENFMTMLSSSAPTLRQLTLECSCAAGEDYRSWPQESVSFPELRELKLAFLPPVPIQYLLLLIDAPNLEQLHLDLDAVDSPEATTEWNRVVEILCTTGYLPTSFPRVTNRKRGKPLFPILRKLVISSFPVDPIHLGIFLHYYQQLTELSIDHNWVPSSFLSRFLAQPLPPLGMWRHIILPRWISQELTDMIRAKDPSKEEATRQWLLPNLKVLRVNNVKGEELRKVVQGRLEAGIPLDELYYDNNCVIKKKDMKWLNANLKVFEEFTDPDEADEDDSEEGSDLNSDEEDPDGDSD
ncbi:hypothetical protein CPB86DRAFT_780034 [Serendipita vermifera]|nr:hypothetical protein CPB86DRAFT_780034 [Serendipita vermifera]